jgi:hypothetical protein
MATPFDTWTLKDVQDKLAEAVNALGPGAYDANAAIVEKHDLWQDGKHWPTSGAVGLVRQKILGAVQPQFTPTDVGAEVVGRVVNALTKKEPNIGFQPLQPAKEGTPEHTAQQAEIAAMLEVVSGWWDKKQLWEKVKISLRWARAARRGLLRAWLPETVLSDGEAGEKRLPRGLDLHEALKRIELVSPEPKGGMIHTDPDTQQKAALILFDRDGKHSAELWFLDGHETVCRVLGGDSEQEMRLPLGLTLPLAQMACEELLTEPVRRQIARLNMFETMLVRLGETAGFPERYTTNAEANGIWLDTPPVDGPAIKVEEDKAGGKTWYMHRVPRQMGAAIMTELRGIELGTDDKGITSITTPGITVNSPTDPDHIIKSADHGYQVLLRTVKQLFALMGSDATATGVSRVQARAEFEADLGNVKGPLEGMIRDIIVAVIRLAELMGKGGPSFLDRYRVVVNVHVDTGPISPEELQAVISLYNAGLLPLEDAMLRIGVEDVSAALERLNADPMRRLDLEEKRLKVLASAVSAGLNVYAAALRIGYTDAEATQLAAAVKPPQPPALPAAA